MTGGIAGDRFPFLREGPVRRLLDALDGRGESIRLVGGVVRNALLGLPISDFDCATTCLPEEVMRRAAQAGLRSVPTGIEHGTITVLADGVPFEVTTLREDIATDGRHASVRFGRSFERDAERRDFTINALYLDREGRLHDPVGGMPDLIEGRLRFIGDASMRIAEDHLRILRFFRFHAAYGRGAIDREGLRAAIAARQSLDRLSRERVRVELMKILVARRAADVLPAMAQCGILGLVTGGVAALGRVLAALTCGVTDAPGRLALLSVEVEEDAARLAERLRLSREEATALGRFARLSTALRASPPGADPAALRRMLYTHREVPRPMLGACLAAAGAQAPLEALRALDSWAVPCLPFTGERLLAAGFVPGAALGQAQRRLEAAWLAADFPDDPARLEAMIARERAGS